MVKSSRQRRQDRRKRQDSAAARARAAQKQRLVEEIVAQAERRWALLKDPTTPAAEVATVIWEQYEGAPVGPGLSLLLNEYRGSVDEVVNVAEALAAKERDQSAGPSLTALTLGAHAAHLAGDHARARTLMEQALGDADDPELRAVLAGHLVQLGRVADACDLLAGLVADPCYDEVGAQAHQDALEQARLNLEGAPPQDECPCGRGLAWSACCGPREAAALAAFRDRSGLYALRTAVAEFLPGSAYERPVARHVADWTDTATTDATEPTEREALERLATEHAWVAAAVNETVDDDHDNVLTALTEDPSTAGDIAAAAVAWRDHVRYGLWQVADPTTEPGLWCVDLVTGRELYVAFAPEQIEGMARWAVLLGAVVPLGGAWRATGTMISVSPQEADGLCETVQAAAEVIANEVAGRRNRAALARARRPVRVQGAEPHNVLAYLRDPASPPVADLLGRVTGAALPRLLAEVQAARATPPTLTNTDGDPLVMIKARIRVQDGAGVMARLAEHPDFEADPGDAARLGWLGREIPAEQRTAMLAEARAQLRAQGRKDTDIADTDEPQRWVRGRIGRRRDELNVEVNSEERLQRLLAVLEQLHAEPVVVDRSAVDPAQDLPWPAGHRPLPGGLAPAAEGWERQWLDERVPALRNRTPREVAGTEDWPVLEGLLRQLEYDADLVARDGGRGVDTGWLRNQLSLPFDRFS